MALPELSHPRSSWLQQMLPDAERHFRLLAKVRSRHRQSATCAAVVACSIMQFRRHLQVLLLQANIGLQCTTSSLLSQDGFQQNCC
jgi:hypothetical protein